eukprot:scaffold1922_cov291-Chaetoceros_neogracile.AAC.6
MEIAKGWVEWGADSESPRSVRMLGFAAYLEPSKATTFKNGRYYEGCNGIVGCVDCQLRNSKLNVPLENGVVTKEYPGLPAHVHVKNMNVDDFVRRKELKNGRLLIHGQEAMMSYSTALGSFWRLELGHFC